MFNVGDFVYVKNTVPFVGTVLKVVRDNALEVQVDFGHQMTSPYLTQRTSVYIVPIEWCVLCRIPKN